MMQLQLSVSEEVTQNVRDSFRVYLMVAITKALLIDLLVLDVLGFKSLSMSFERVALIIFKCELVSMELYDTLSPFNMLAIELYFIVLTLCISTA